MEKKNEKNAFFESSAFMDNYITTRSRFFNGREKRMMHCLNPAHTDDNPSMSFYEKNGKAKVHCFSCGCSFDIYNVAALDLLTKKELKDVEDAGLTGAQQKIKEYTKNNFKKIYKYLEALNTDPNVKAETFKFVEAKKEVKDYTSYYKKLEEEGSYAIDYMASRGISEKVVRNAKIFSNKAKKLIIIPQSPTHYSVRNITPGIPKSKRYVHYGTGLYDPSNIFGEGILEAKHSGNLLFDNENDIVERLTYSQMLIVLSEGEINTLSIFEAIKDDNDLNKGQITGLGIGGATKIRLVIDLLTKIWKFVKNKYGFKDDDKSEAVQKEFYKLMSNFHFCIAFDNDEAGRAATFELTNLLNHFGCNVYSLYIPSSYNDTNDYLLADKKSLALRLRTLYMSFVKKEETK